jgi:hypothetical protein
LAAVDELGAAWVDKFGSAVRLAGMHNFYARGRTAGADELTARARTSAWSDHLRARRWAIGRMLRDEWLAWRRSAARTLLRRWMPPMVWCCAAAKQESAIEKTASQIALIANPPHCQCKPRAFPNRKIYERYQIAPAGGIGRACFPVVRGRYK